MTASNKAVPPVWLFPTSLGLARPVEFRHLAWWANAGNPGGAVASMFVLGVGRSGSVEDDLVGMARRCVTFWAAVGGLAGLLAVARLRGERLSAPPAPGTVRGRPKVAADRPPVPDRSVAWWAEYGHLTPPQMRYIARFGWRRYVRWLVVSAAVLGFCRWWGDRYPDLWPHFGVIGKVGGPLVMIGWAAIMLVVPLMMGAQLLAKERAADTLPGLTLTALTARDVVVQKWLGLLRPLRHTLVAGVCWAVPAVATGFLPWWAALIALVAAPYLAPCWAALGLGFSAHASTPANAQRNLSAVLFGGGYVLGAVLAALIGVLPTAPLR